MLHTRLRGETLATVGTRVLETARGRRRFLANLLLEVLRDVYRRLVRVVEAMLAWQTYIIVGGLSLEDSITRLTLKLPRAGKSLVRLLM